MENNNVCSVKKNFDKIIKLIWGVIAIFLAIIIIVSFSEYSKYKEVQEFVVNVTLDATDEFDDVKDDYNTLVEKMYKYYNPEHYSGYYNGFYVDNSDVIEAREDADKALANLIEQTFGESNFFGGSYYLGDTNYIEYFASRYYIEFGIWLIPFAIWFIVSLLYFIDKKQSLIVSEEKVACKNGKKITKEFFIKDIKSVQITKTSGLKIQGNGIRYNINLLKNPDEIKKFIMDNLEKLNITTNIVQNNQTSNLDELKKIKELFDMGAITQEEFDEKKKQLLKLK